MGADTKIEWTDASWTPIRARNRANGKVGWHCEHDTTGCEFCYSESMNKRLGTGLPFKPGHRKDIEIFLDEEMLLAPLRWKKPRMVFVCSMTDLFADFVPDEWIDRVFTVMALCPQHTFQVLTKRAERMRDYMQTPDRKRTIAERSMDISDLLAREAGTWKARPSLDHFSTCFAGRGPFRNVWLGVSCERQQEWDERTEYLRETPAAIRFVSIEPMLGPINCGALSASKLIDDPGIDWIICGGESGSKARGTPRANFLSVRDQCAATGVAYFHKQNGEWIDADEWLDTIECGPSRLVTGGVQWKPQRPLNYEDAATLARFTGNRCYEHQSDGTTLIRVGKKSAGRLLDGREHNAFPVIDRSASQCGLSPHENKTAEATPS